jgi:hypothetical protein
MMLQRQFDRWLFEEYRTDPDSLGLYRIIYASYLLLVGLPWGLWVRDLPQASFNPPVSIAALFTDYPSFWVMLALNVVAVVAAAALLIGWRTVASSLTVAGVLLLIHGFSYADGKIDQIVVLVLIPLTLAYSGWGRSFSVGGRDEPPAANQAWLLALLALLTGFALFTAGMAKMTGGWLAPGSLGTRWHLLWNYYSVGRETLAGAWALDHLPHWGWKALDWSVSIWEAGFVLTVFRRTWCRIACAFGAFFHLGVWMLFSIIVAENLITYAAFVSWAFVLPSAASWLRTTSRQWSPGTRLALCAIPFVVGTFELIWFDSPAVEQLHQIVRLAVLFTAPVVAVVYLLSLVRPQSRYGMSPGNSAATSAAQPR